MVPSKYAVVDYNKCEVEAYNDSESFTGCPAARECPKDVLIQEDLDDPPMLMSPRMCVGCGKCVPECPVSAIKINT